MLEHMTSMSIQGKIRMVWIAALTWSQTNIGLSYKRMNPGRMKSMSPKGNLVKGLQLSITIDAKVRKYHS